MLDTWLDEDLGRGDLTQSGINSSKIVNAHWECKQKGIFCGGELVKCLYNCLDPSVIILLKKTDGENADFDIEHCSHCSLTLMQL